MLQSIDKMKGALDEVMGMRAGGIKLVDGGNKHLERQLKSGESLG